MSILISCVISLRTLMSCHSYNRHSCPTGRTEPAHFTIAGDGGDPDVSIGKSRRLAAACLERIDRSQCEARERALEFTRSVRWREANDAVFG